MYFAGEGRVNFVLRPAMEGKVHFYERGVSTRVWPDDRTARFRELFEKAKSGPVLVRE